MVDPDQRSSTRLRPDEAGQQRTLGRVVRDGGHETLGRRAAEIDGLASAVVAGDGE